ncbi:uncharacterized protein zgc:113184 [Corythoichthys intestinalis]|uniref:uncharacterized protein zgc:113184 n=1 Tax=Corythoichthys intestinalis TaxID=161448 RepID=UPI0025A4D7FB|nr:uncharacterized protein zgc:113184 [Corythoichthys intestinalis]
MEAAYRELYQEFVRLRSLCLRQAALLNRLLKTLQHDKGLPAERIQANFQGNPISAYNPATRTDLWALPANEKTSALLAEDTAALDGEAQQKVSLGRDALTNTISSDAPGGSGSLQDSGGMSDGQLFGFDLPSLPGGLPTSDLTLQSHECDFCHAVFPGHATTRGEFLQHLHKHVA